MANPFAEAVVPNPFTASSPAPAPQSAPGPLVWPGEGDPFATGDPFAAPVRFSRAPNMTSLNGRLLLFRPKSSATVEKVDPVTGAKRPVLRVTSDIDVLDGEFPIREIDGKLNEPTGNAFDDSHYEDVWVESASIANNLQAILSGKVPGATMVLGRVKRVKTKSGFIAWVLEDPTDADKVVARQYLARHSNPLA